MFKKSMLGLALYSTLATTAQATLMASGEVRTFNFSAGTSTSGATAVNFFPMAAGAGEMTLEFFDGLNLGGTNLGTFDWTVDSSWQSLAGLLDGTFSMRAAQTSGTPELGDDAGLINARWTYDDLTGSRPRRVIVAEAAGSATATVPPGGNVPEPGSLLLVALAGLALCATRRRSMAA